MIKEIKYGTHEEWLSIRSHYIGGSDAGAVIGMNPYKSAYSLWAEKTGKVPGFEGNTITKVGAFLEDFVAQMFEEETGKKVHRKNMTMVNEEYPFACANIDRKVVGENAFVEIKTTNNPLAIKQCKSGEFPEIYYAQCVHYMAVGGYEKCYLAVLIQCRELKIYELSRDQGEIDALMTAEKEFWKLVETDTPPAVDGSDATTETLKTLYPESAEGCSVDLSGYEASLREYTELGDRIKELTKIKDEKANEIKEFMKEAEKGESLSFKVSYASQERNTFDSKKFSKDHPEMDLSGYYKTSSVRMLRISEKKGA